MFSLSILVKKNNDPGLSKEVLTATMDRINGRCPLYQIMKTWPCINKSDVRRNQEFWLEFTHVPDLIKGETGVGTIKRLPRFVCLYLVLCVTGSHDLVIIDGECVRVKQGVRDKYKIVAPTILGLFTGSSDKDLKQLDSVVRTLTKNEDASIKQDVNEIKSRLGRYIHSG